MVSVDFTTPVGLDLSASGDDSYIKMNFPLYDTIDYSPSQSLFDAFGLTQPLLCKFSKDLDMLIIEVKDRKTLENLKPNFQKAIESPDQIKELVVTAQSEEKDYDFYSRCFCPWIGINEDPVTGASHSVLAKYWGEKLGKNEMSAFQLSNRGGFLKLKILNDKELEVRSNAKIIFSGSLEI